MCSAVCPASSWPQSRGSAWLLEGQPFETPAERLARLQKQKEAVDRDIEQLTTKEKERTP